jgi:hypothetical protein
MTWRSSYRSQRDASILSGSVLPIGKKRKTAPINIADHAAHVIWSVSEGKAYPDPNHITAKRDENNRAIYPACLSRSINEVIANPSKPIIKSIPDEMKNSCILFLP